MTTGQSSRSPGFLTQASTSPSDEASETGPPTVPSPRPPTADGRPTSGGSPVVGTSCPGVGDEPPKLVPVMTGDEDGKAAAAGAAAAAKRLQVHWSHGRKRRASGDSHEVLSMRFILYMYNL